MPTYVFTSATLDYLPKVRVLAQTVKAHDPRARFCLLLADLRSAVTGVTAPECDEIACLEDLGIRGLESWSFTHSLVELCTAIKGRFFERLLARPDCDAVYYFDPDIVVLGDLRRVSERFADGSILLTPHLSSPETSLDAVRDNEIAALKHGVFNLGFIAVRASPQGREFAAWWWDRLRHFCYDDIAAGLFTDQRWIDLAPVFFDAVAIVRDTSWNVATWNLAHRTVQGDLAHGLRVDGEPLLFYHFSGLDSGAQLAMMEKYGGSMPGLFELRRWYVGRCRQLEAESGGLRWSLGTFEDGEPITALHRREYRDRPDLAEAFPDPYRTEGGEPSYRDWFAATYGEVVDGGLDDPSRLAEVYRSELEAIRHSRSWRAVRWLSGLIG